MRFINTTATWILPVLLLASAVQVQAADEPDTATATIETKTLDSLVKNAIVQFDNGRTHYRNEEYAKAYKLWVIAADANILEAYNNLGYLSYNGMGVKQNLTEGLRLWQIAADNGFSESQIHLAQAYAEGISVQKDLIAAYALAKAAAYFAVYVGDDELRKSFEQDSQELIHQYSAILSETERKQAEEKADSLISTISENLESTQYV